MAFGATVLLARLAGAPRQLHQTPTEFGRRLAALLPSRVDALERVVDV